MCAEASSFADHDDRDNHRGNRNPARRHAFPFAAFRDGRCRGPARRASGEANLEQLGALGLDPREAEVLFWVTRGKTNDVIATVLGIGLTTVKQHLESTYAKLGGENRTTAAAMALERMGTG